MLNYEIIVDKVNAHFGREVVTLTHVTKTNDVKRTGLMIMQDSKIRPTIYVEQYENDGEAAEFVINFIDNMEIPSFVDSDITNFNKVKGNLRLALINRKANEEYLKDIPHLPFLDLEIVFKVRVDENATATVTNVLMDTWGKTADELFEIATKNMRYIKNISNFFDSMNVVSTTENTYGAGIIAVPGILDELSKKFGDFALIPSSVHEWIVQPGVGEDDYCNLSDMIQQVNKDVLKETDILSSHPYFFIGGKLS